MAEKLTNEQQAAVDSRERSLLVSAAAGSGKTKVLVERLFSYVEREGANLDDFLIITYTRAAASELRGKIAKALDASRGMGKEETRAVESGVSVQTLSFERLVQTLAEDHQLFVMDRKGTSIREQAFEGNPCFLLTDHIPMPKKILPSLERLGARKLSLGGTMLFASQCVVLIHHALDQR